MVDRGVFKHPYILTIFSDLPVVSPWPDSGYRALGKKLTRVLYYSKYLMLST